LISGATGSAKHTWTSQGNYQIKVKAKDTNGLESDWAELTVTMPRNKDSNILLLQLFDRFQGRFPLFAQLLKLI
jgi:hypothetical protein